MNDKFTCIEEVTKTVKLTLPSLYNKNETNGICNVLESWKRQYVKQVQGIVVGYKNVSVKSKRGIATSDSPVTLCYIKATFELFHPNVGRIVKGKINRVSHDHIGCLVHNTINVTLHRASDIPGAISKFIALERFILFEITRISFSHKVIHMKGRITEECITLMKESHFFNEEINVFGTGSSNVDDVSSNSSRKDFSSGLFNASSQVLSHTKKKKGKKSKGDGLTSPSLFDESVDANIKEIESTQPLDPATKKKKHKKSKFGTASKEMTTNVNNIDSNVNVTDDIDQTSPFSHLSSMSINEIEPTQPLATTAKKKHKKSRTKTVSREIPYPTNIFESMVTIKEEVCSNSSQISLSPTEVNEIEPSQLPNTTLKEMHNKSKIESTLKQMMDNISTVNSTLDIKDEINTDSSSTQSSGKSQKTKKSPNVSPEKISSFNSLFAPHLSLGLQNSVENSNNFSSPQKKRKHKKSQDSTFELSYPSLDEPPKKKHKKTKFENSNKKLENNLDSVLSINETDPASSNNHLPFIKSEEDPEIFNSHTKESSSSFISSLDNHLNEGSIEDNKVLDGTKKSKKRKRDSSDIDSLQKKKKKAEKSKNKDKSLKKKKGDKSEKDSKKNKKKKSKDKVISTKKRQQGYKGKLEKKNKHKGKKTKIPKKSKSDKKKKKGKKIKKCALTVAS